MLNIKNGPTVENVFSTCPVSEVHENGPEVVANRPELQGIRRERSGYEADFLKRKVPQSNPRPYVFLECLEKSRTKVSTICLKSCSNYMAGRKTHSFK